MIEGCAIDSSALAGSSLQCREARLRLGLQAHHATLREVRPPTREREGACLRQRLWAKGLAMSNGAKRQCETDGRGDHTRPA